MPYFAVPTKTILTIDYPTSLAKQSIFSKPKLKIVEMDDIVTAFNASQTIQLFQNEQDAINCANSRSGDHFDDGCRKFQSPPILIVSYEGQVTDSMRGQTVKPTEVTLLSAKMIFVGRITRAYDLPFEPVNKKRSRLSTKFLSAEFDLRIAAVLFALGATLGNSANSLTVNREKLTSSVLLGCLAVYLYLKWCNSHNTEKDIERDTNNEIDRLCSYNRSFHCS